ncbi:MAG: hypothetical protein JWO63_2066, partial [Frankiales bacterium]|nr:hypothetical protein [Frankiales bacterium]
MSIGPHERLQAWFTDPAAHETALRAVLEHPELVDFRIAPRSERARSAVRAEVDALLGAHAGSWYGVGDRVSTISVSLAGSATELAAELHRRFGDAVEITIASFKYPLEPGAQRREPPGGVV